jgi:hydroxymethylpyrimidine pyrophosphatase-like HAD family hydrolase
MVVTKRLSDHCTGDVQAFLFFGQDAVDGFKQRIGDRYAGVLNMAYGVSETFPPYLNVVNGGADKGKALQLVCGRLGVPVEQSMAIGDAAPDLQMMHAAGIGMAMGNAPDDVKAQADIVGPGNMEDGVAWAIERYALTP